MDVLMLIVLMYSATFGGSDAAWCVCNSDQSTPALQKTIDYACGAGADCTPILQNGACYEPNTVAAHCSYAANSYYQRKGQALGACDFSGTATLTSADPSGPGCTFPASPSAAGTSTSSSSTTPTTAPGSTTPAGSSTPTTPTTTFTPTAGGGGSGTAGSTGGGGILGGLGPAGTTTSIDGTGSDGGLPPNPTTAGFIFLSLITTFLSLSSFLFF
ncbi:PLASMODESMATA CALLOSE-BINDING PROTEIN 3-like [Ananas comosus]|uniref:Plasmodesmata callose-binding protein 3 n=2 Tax=Ananas comosus TaxID=4615 RepID=A0A199VL98_ANACO|nr:PLASMODESMATA CALLOSE-BINDING PROTEIN 3-like [Ananas comosus]OAY77947.1 plasmodesmata callose-binding protein 3 [Ananas comosus]CAD1822625.1 unnamed protein product [Ananas comosus var. bracteatus]